MNSNERKHCNGSKFIKHGENKPPGYFRKYIATACLISLSVCVCVVVYGNALTAEARDLFYADLTRICLFIISGLYLPIATSLLVIPFTQMPEKIRDNLKNFLTDKWFRKPAMICFISTIIIFSATLGAIAPLAVYRLDSRNPEPEPDVEQAHDDVPESVPDTAAPLPIIPLDNSDPFFYVPKFFNNDEDAHRYLTEICDRVILFLISTPYREATELHQIYHEYANMAAGGEEEARRKYHIQAYEGMANLVSDTKKSEIRLFHINWLKLMLPCLANRKRAHEYSTTYENTKEMGNYNIGIGDAYFRLEEYEEAYKAYLQAVTEYVVALQLALTSANRVHNIIYVIGQLECLYGKHRLQNPLIIDYFINDSGTREQLIQTELFYKALLLRADEICMPD